MTGSILVVGAGVTGATLAERYASAGYKVTVIDKRDHTAGSCYDYIDKAGLLVPKYGPHMFHTNHEDVWQYINKFSKWLPYEHRVLSYVDRKLVPVPVNITTVNMLFGLKLGTAEQMDRWLAENTEHIENPRNSEEVCLNRVGKVLYQKMFRNYTKKQWGVYPDQLDPCVLGRVPVRANADDRYFTDTHLAMPSRGYTALVGAMLNNPNITIRLNTPFKKEMIAGYDKVFYTGPIDEFYDYRFGRLEYRSQTFTHKTYNKEYYQPVAVVNYPNDFKFTRVTEPKHATGQKHQTTTVIREYSGWEGEPTYPMQTKRNQDLYKRYQELASAEQSIYFVGRLGGYKYLNIDQAFKDALDLFNQLEVGYG